MVFTLECGGLSTFLKVGDSYNLMAGEQDEDNNGKEEKEEKEDKEEKERKSDKFHSGCLTGSFVKAASYYQSHQRHHFCEAHITDILSPPPEA